MSKLFLNIHMLYLIAGIPFIWALMYYASCRRREAMRKFNINDPGTTDPMQRISQSRFFINILLGLAYIMIVAGVCRPIWNTENTEQPGSGADIIFILDISQSMLAQDQPQSRLEYAKNAILQCVQKISGGRVALIAFAGSPTIKCPLTNDLDFFNNALMELQPESATIGGTRIGDAINKAVERLLINNDSEYKHMLMITDGEDHADNATNSINRLNETDAKLIIIGIGDNTIGAEIPIYDETTKSPKPMQYKGQIVRTIQQSNSLQNIAALANNGVYVNVGTNPFDLYDIFTRFVATHQATTGTKTVARPKEQYQMFFLAGLLCILLTYIVSVRRKSPTFTKLAASAVMLLTMNFTALPDSQNQQFQAGLDSYSAGNYQKSVAEFNELISTDTDPRIHYNLSNAYYKLGQMQQAADGFLYAYENSENIILQERAIYNLGNSYFNLAFSSETKSKDAAITLLQQTILCYESALSINPENVDAQFNMDAARAILSSLSTQPNSDNNQQTDDADENADENDNSDEQPSENTDQSTDTLEDEMDPPVITPDEILEEEERNKLVRSREKHAEFSKTEKNW